MIAHKANVNNKPILSVMSSIEKNHLISVNQSTVEISIKYTMRQPNSKMPIITIKKYKSILFVIILKITLNLFKKSNKKSKNSFNYKIFFLSGYSLMITQMVFEVVGWMSKESNTTIKAKSIYNTTSIKMSIKIISYF
jgi:hypothetical protein